VDGEEVVLSIGRGNFLVKVSTRFWEVDKLRTFAELSMELFDLVSLGRPAGIELLAGQANEIILCQICGEEIIDNAVECRRCQTPHHHDCWEYFGRCSTYGCHETRFVTTGSAAPHEPAKPQQSELGQRTKYEVRITRN
jgi:hypothetical protein